MVTAGLGFGCLHTENITQYWISPLGHLDVAWIIWAIPGTTLTSAVCASVCPSLELTEQCLLTPCINF